MSGVASRHRAEEPGSAPARLAQELYRSLERDTGPRSRALPAAGLGWPGAGQGWAGLGQKRAWRGVCCCLYRGSPSCSGAVAAVCSAHPVGNARPAWHRATSEALARSGAPYPPKRSSRSTGPAVEGGRGFRPPPAPPQTRPATRTGQTQAGTSLLWSYRTAFLRAASGDCPAFSWCCGDQELNLIYSENSRSRTGLNAV